MPPSPALLLSMVLLCACGGDGQQDPPPFTGHGRDTGDPPARTDPDINGDGALTILVLGTDQSVDGRTGFSAEPVAAALSAAFGADPDAPGTVTVDALDIHMEKDVTIGLGGRGDEYTYTHHGHSLLQLLAWPDGQAERLALLSGEGGTAWDFVVIAADPWLVAHTPGYHALGAHAVADLAAAGGAQPLLLMGWPQDDDLGSSIEHFEEVAYRVGDGARVELPVVPAGLAWDALPEADRDEADEHPSPTGAALAAAALYSHMTGLAAPGGDEILAWRAHEVVRLAAEESHHDGAWAFASPFQACGVTDETLTWNHTGSSSENGILGGLNWVFDQASQTLAQGTDTPITFNYGRANTNFEPDKRYVIDAERFRFSFGFAMQDHGNHGDESMLYGLDVRDSGVVNDTDLGVARYMVEEGELPTARAIPIRTLFAQMKAIQPELSAYRDQWHMSRELDKASGAYMHTLLTGECPLGAEPEDADSGEWTAWMAHKVGCDTAWTVMTLDGDPAW